MDCNGHGAYVAATVGGKVYGIARSASLHAVRVLNCEGSGTTAGVAEAPRCRLRAKARRGPPPLHVGASILGGKCESPPLDHARGRGPCVRSVIWESAVTPGIEAGRYCASGCATRASSARWGAA
ncbi:hypothetical protein [Corallococcus carmarthensis]|uniref:hypothetical protein n=1 Tax=Corallococcus carmarthensis TaxID=2316728 RepID=UPI003F655A39